jgi:hypothetical protein
MVFLDHSIPFVLVILINIASHETVDRRIIIGYRTVSKVCERSQGAILALLSESIKIQAHNYNRAGTPTYTGPRAGTRIGKGVYMTEDAGQ